MASSSRIERKARVVSEIDDARRKPVFRVKKKKKNNRRDERKVRYTNLESIISRRRKRSRYSHSPSSSSDEEGDGGDTSSSSTEDEDDNPFKEVSDDSPPFTNEIAVDVDEMYEIEELCKTNSACIRAVHILEVIMLSSGLSLTMDYNGQTILPNEVMQKVFRVEWGQKFIHDLLWHLFMFGFAVVNGVDSNISEGEVVPMVCEKSTYMLCFIEKFDDRREYRVYPMDEIGAYEAYGYDRGKSRRRQENMDKNVGVYIMNAPMSNGHLSSKFASIIDDLIQVAWCKLNFSKTDYNSSNWPVFMEDVPSKGDKASPLESAVAAGENALECFLEEQYAKFEDQHRANVDGQAEAYARAHSKHVEQLEARGFYGKLGKSRFASDPPYVNRFMPGIGRRFANVSAPPLNPHLIELTEKLESTVCGVLGVPTELMGSAHATHAANVEMSMRVLGKTVTALQEFLVPILGDLCDKYHQQSLDEWIDGSKEKTRYDPTTDRMEGNKFIPTHGEPTQADMSREPEIPTLSKQIHLTKLMGTPMVLDEDGQVRHPKFGLAKPPAVASDEQMEELRPYVRFRVTFKRSLLTDVDSIIMAYDQYCMINWHELTTEYSDITGMDPSKMLDEKTRLAEMEKKLKFAHEMATKYPLAPPLPIMGQPATGKGPAAEQKKQPAAPPGPSKKKSEKKPSAKKTEAGKPSTTGASSSSSKKRKK